MGVSTFRKVLLDPDLVLADLDDLAGGEGTLVLLLAARGVRSLLLLLRVAVVLLLVHGLLLRRRVALRHLLRVARLLVVLLLRVSSVHRLRMSSYGVRHLLGIGIRRTHPASRPALLVRLGRSVHGGVPAGSALLGAAWAAVDDRRPGADSEAPYA